MSNKLSIRPATLADSELLSELGSRTFTETFAAENTRENMTAYVESAFSKEQQLGEITDSSTSFYIAELDRIPMGYAMLRSGGREACINGDNPIELVRLYVLRKFIGEGVGASLMQTCIEHANRLGHDTLWLGVWEHNHRALQFYQRWNFRQVGTHAFQLGDDCQTDFLMELRLTRREAT